MHASRGAGAVKNSQINRCESLQGFAWVGSGERGRFVPVGGLLAAPAQDHPTCILALGVGAYGGT